MTTYERPRRLAIITKVLAASAPVFDGKKLVRPKNFDDILALEGIDRKTWSKWINEDPVFANMEKEVREAQTAVMGKAALKIIEDALTGNMRLKDDKLVDVALRFAEKTQPEWKETIDLNVKSQDFSVPTSSLEERAAALLKIIKDKNEPEPTEQ